MDALRVLGTSWCGDCARSKAFLTAHQIEFEWIDIERDVNASIEVEEHNGGKRVVPTIVWADGTVLVEPSDRELAAKLGIA